MYRKSIIIYFFPTSPINIIRYFFYLEEFVILENIINLVIKKTRKKEEIVIYEKAK